MKAKILTFFMLISFQYTMEQERPNIIFILADDMGYGDVSFLNKKSKIKTTHIDQLAREGKTFVDAHSSSSVCTPTRYGIMTGKYGWRSAQKKGVSRQYDPPLIDNNEWTIGKMFQESHYSTACIGKWHLGWDWPLKNGGWIKDSISGLDASAEERLRLEKSIDFSKPLSNGPLSKGFDYYFGDDVPNYPPYCFIENDKTIGIPDHYKPDSLYGHPGLMFGNWSLENVMPAITKKASQYIKDQASLNHPFFLYFALTSPHVPIAPSKYFQGKSKAGAYGDFILETDWAVGEIIKAVHESGIEKNTLIIFSSDNGSTGQDGKNMSGAFNAVLQYGHNPHEPFRGMKTDLWEGGHHVPFFAWWPGKISAHTTEKTTICLNDLLSTCADMLHINIPKNKAIDSYSLLPLLKNQKRDDYKRPYTIHHSSEGFYAIRKENWKLILTGNSGGGLIVQPKELDKNGKEIDIQLFNLKKDPEEKVNLYLNFPEKVKDLKQLLLQALQQ